MKINYFAKELRPIGTLAQHSLNDAAELMRELFTGTLDQEKKLSYWQLIFLQSKANGCLDRIADFPQARWQWPKETWFQARLGHKL